MNARLEKVRSNASKRSAFASIEVVYDIVFILNANSKGWILDKICKIVARYSGLNCFFLYSERNDEITWPLPKSRAYFFAHFSLAFWAMVKIPAVFRGKIYIYFTHFDKTKGISLSELSDSMNFADHVFTMNSADRRALVSLGVKPHLVSAIIGGADPDVFLPHSRGSGAVGFVGAYYARKEPAKIIGLVRAMPDTQFLLLAPGPEDVENRGLLWYNWSDFPALSGLPNLRYVEAPYEDYPKYYAEMDVYVSLSSQEGGPIPVVEAMMSNVIPVATDTGFARDVLVGPLQEFMVDLGAEVSTIAGQVKAALRDKATDVRALAENYSWEAVANQILGVIRSQIGDDHLAEPITVGSLVHFGQGLPGRRFLAAGWRFEDGRAWMAGPLATLLFRLAGDAGGLYRIRIALRRKNMDDGFQMDAVLRTDCHINGRLVASGEIASGEEQILESWFELSSDEVRQTLEATLSLSSTEIGVDVSESMEVAIEQLRVDRMGMIEPALEYRFTSADCVQECFGGDWHRPEDIGCWSKSKKAHVVAFIPITDQERRYVPEITGRIFGSKTENGAEVAISVFYDGQSTTANFTFDNDYPDTLKLAPLTLNAGSNRPIVFTLARKRTCSPAQLVQSQDQRELGFFLQKIEFKPVENEIGESASSDSTLLS